MSEPSTNHTFGGYAGLREFRRDWKGSIGRPREKSECNLCLEDGIVKRWLDVVINLKPYIYLMKNKSMYPYPKLEIHSGPLFCQGLLHEIL